MKELKRSLLNKEITLQEIENVLYHSDIVYDTYTIYDASMLEENVLDYSLADNPDIHIYIVIEFTEKNIKEPWNSYVVVKDMYLM